MSTLQTKRQQMKEKTVPCFPMWLLNMFELQSASKKSTDTSTGKIHGLCAGKVYQERKTDPCPCTIHLLEENWIDRSLVSGS